MSWRKDQGRSERGYHHGNLKEALLQAALGVATLLSGAEIALATLHQVNAVLLLTFVIYPIASTIQLSTTNLSHSL